MMKFVRVYTEPRETSADEQPYGGVRGRFNPGGGLGFGGPGNGGALAFRKSGPSSGRHPDDAASREHHQIGVLSQHTSSAHPDESGVADSVKRTDNGAHRPDHFNSLESGLEADS